jgi:hypothetical protein
VDVAGTIFTFKGELWSVRGYEFYWVIDTLAREVADPALAAKLREIDEMNLGALNLARLSALEGERILKVICTSLVPTAERELPTAAPERIARLRELVALCCGYAMIPWRRARRSGH